MTRVRVQVCRAHPSFWVCAVGGRLASVCGGSHCAERCAPCARRFRERWHLAGDLQRSGCHDEPVRALRKVTAGPGTLQYVYGTATVDGVPVVPTTYVNAAGNSVLVFYLGDIPYSSREGVWTYSDSDSFHCPAGQSVPPK